MTGGIRAGKVVQDKALGFKSGLIENSGPGEGRRASNFGSDRVLGLVMVEGSVW